MTEPIVIIEYEEDEPSVFVDLDSAPSAYCPVPSRERRRRMVHRMRSVADGVPREVVDLEQEFIHSAPYAQSDRE